MSTTRRAQLDHLLDDILEAHTDNDHPIRLIATAQGAVSVTDMINITDVDLNLMTLQDSSNAPVSITNAIKNRILSLPDFYIHYVNKSTNDWTTLTAIDFDTFMLTGTGPYTPTPTATTPTSGGTSTTTIDSATLAAIAAAVGTATTSAVTSAPRHTPDPLETFLKNKGNVEDYKPLREAKFWNVWHRAFIATVHAQGLEDMVDPTFIPPTRGAAGYDVWQAKQKHAFAILSSTLLESGSQQIVRRYSDQSDPTTFGDAQSIYQDLVLHFTGGVAAATTLESLEREIDQLRWDRKWSKTFVAFLTMVDHKLVDHRGLAPFANFPDTWYIKKLNATFKNHNEITPYIGQLALQEVTYTRVSGAAVTTALTYDIQVSHLRDFCIMLDAHHQEQAAANRAHTAMKTEIKKSLGIHTSEGINKLHVGAVVPAVEGAVVVVVVAVVVAVVVVVEVKDAVVDENRDAIITSSLMMNFGVLMRKDTSACYKNALLAVSSPSIPLIPNPHPHPASLRMPIVPLLHHTQYHLLFPLPLLLRLHPKLAPRHDKLICFRFHPILRRLLPVLLVPLLPIWIVDCPLCYDK